MATQERRPTSQLNKETNQKKQPVFHWSIWGRMAVFREKDRVMAEHSALWRLHREGNWACRIHQKGFHSAGRGQAGVPVSFHFHCRDLKHLLHGEDCKCWEAAGQSVLSKSASIVLIKPHSALNPDSVAPIYPSKPSHPVNKHAALRPAGPLALAQNWQWVTNCTRASGEGQAPQPPGDLQISPMFITAKAAARALH